MATERQIEANRINARASRGPTSDEGKERSRGNSYKHGLAGSGPVVQSSRQAEFDERRAVWGNEVRPGSVEASFALDVAVGATFRIEECRRAFDSVVASQNDHARLTWDEDRHREAVDLLATLPKNPSRVIHHIESTAQGADLVIEIWTRLADALADDGAWNDYETSMALDLLGFPVETRDRATPIDPPAGVETNAFRRRLAASQMERLQGLKDRALNELDGLNRRLARVSALVLLSKPATLVLRYEREALRTYNRSIHNAKAPASLVPENEAPIVEGPKPAPVPPPQPTPAPRQQAQTIRPEERSEPARTSSTESRESRRRRSIEAGISSNFSAQDAFDETNPISIGQFSAGTLPSAGFGPEIESVLRPRSA